MALKLVCVIAMLSLMGGCLAPPEPSREASFTPLERQGWEVFRREPCFLACHVATVASPSPRRALPGFVPDLRKTPRRTRDWYLAYFVDPRSVLPYSPMPSFDYLSSEEMDALIAFLKRLNRDMAAPKPEPVTSAEIPRIPRDLPAYKAGRALYETYCVGCHGVAGNGGGSVGHLLSPEPRNFTDAMWLSKQTENYLFSIITAGKPNTAMPGFKDILTPHQRALALRYIEYFADPVAKERMEVGIVERVGEGIR